MSTESCVHTILLRPIPRFKMGLPDAYPAFDRAAPYKKFGSKPFSNVSLDGDGYIRLNDVLTVYPVSRAAWYDGILKGIYPAGVKLGPRSVGWSRAAIRELIANPPKF